MAADEHHQLNGHKSEQTPGDSGRQRSLQSQGVRRYIATEQQQNHVTTIVSHAGTQ